MTPDHAAAGFQHTFERPPAFVVRAPGRVNLIGDHTDYSDGLVLPIAIDRALYVAAGPSERPFVEVYSKQYDETARLSLSAEDVESSSWMRYVHGVVAMLSKSNVEVRGARLWVGGDVPPGGGLSSSAALEVGIATALLKFAGAAMGPHDLAVLCRRAENEYAGSPCGIMDQLCCTSARAGHALMIDCRSLRTENVPLALPETELVVVDTGARHSIATGEYGLRRRQCAEALKVIQDEHPTIGSLRDVTPELLTSIEGSLDATLLRRVRHVVTENRRVFRAAEALAAGDPRGFGRLMTASHESLRDDYEVSCAELDEAVSIALSADGVYGARMTGGGFGGCAIVLAGKRAVSTLLTAIGEQYAKGRDRQAGAYVVKSADGAAVAM